MTGELAASARRVQWAIREAGLPLQVVELPATTRSAEEAARAIGCLVEQIAKSLIFCGQKSGEPVLVIASGRNRIDERRLEVLVGEPVAKADAEYVRARTGYAIGGVPPVGHSQSIRTFLDRDLFDLDEIWAAAGTPHAVFRLTPADLKLMTRGDIVSIAQH
jgi:prolyl-tRNA editing enzyme YbaK/EbsC (Cys-tRNA(Pro) deacylase)